LLFLCEKIDIGDSPINDIEKYEGEMESFLEHRNNAEVN